MIGKGGVGVQPWRQTGSAWSDISGAVTSTYAVSEADEREVLRVNASDIEQTSSSTATTNVVDVAPSVAVSGSPQVDRCCLRRRNWARMASRMLAQSPISGNARPMASLGIISAARLRAAISLLGGRIR
jgi:hypothetical protein